VYTISTVFVSSVSDTVNDPDPPVRIPDALFLFIAGTDLDPIEILEDEDSVAGELDAVTLSSEYSVIDKFSKEGVYLDKSVVE
jgi:hypothetical protein